MRAIGAYKTGVFLSVFLMLLLSCSMGFILTEADHDCTLDACPICIAIQRTLDGGGGG
jgi:hypothetical protein